MKMTYLSPPPPKMNFIREVYDSFGNNSLSSVIVIIIIRIFQHILAYSSLFMFLPAYAHRFKPLPTFIILLHPIPTYSSLFQSNPAYSSIFYPVPVFYSLFQAILAYFLANSSLFKPTPAYSSQFQPFPVCTQLRTLQKDMALRWSLWFIWHIKTTASTTALYFTTALQQCTLVLHYITAL